MAEAIAIIFESAEGVRHEVAARLGASLMEAALMNNVPGIEAECGGSCICATCHVYCDQVADIVGAPSDEEDDMLDLAAADRRAASRLSCQIKVTSALAGAIIQLPARQY
ncbi:2Fe-2S iron-sulfur cluster binding domain-containing protein [Chelativorans sp. ZYF759]|uniref:2Fe-2S iron-sulfur cluster-binding protein n=1 Tax=Chelativorans sp. ZYF759 TaxID=2692213 RepID=UPI00145F778D|nr:2Fe-2S iron-sulfur cluster-binding protein [Chelativorans sp. ZYF759]NMG37848.1 2Fe-2S iron-sulfur cluster binding domain-containing protein [Chelativorans sp. ZYF759]